MLTWAFAYLVSRGVSVSGGMFLFAIVGDIASFFFLAVAFAGWPK